jgi:hypothetical protein
MDKTGITGCGISILIMLYLVVLVVAADKTTRDRYERVIVAHLALYAEEQEYYKSRNNDTAGGPAYAREFVLLKSLGIAEIQRLGYACSECSAIGGAAIDCRQTYAACATPIKYGRICRKTFLVITGEIWAKDLGHSEFVADVPNDLPGERWELVSPRSSARSRDPTPGSRK